MEALFKILADVLRIFLDLIPRPYIVPATHSAIKFSGGRKVVILNSGWHVYLPIRSIIRKIPTVPQMLQLPAQSLLNREKESITIKGAVFYEIVDTKNALTKIHQLDKVIREISLSLFRMELCENVLNNDHYECSLQICRNVQNKLSEKTEGFGIKIIEVMLSDYALTFPISIVGQKQNPTTLIS